MERSGGEDEEAGSPDSGSSGQLRVSPGSGELNGGPGKARAAVEGAARNSL